MPASSFSATVVTFRPNLPLFERAVRSLAESVAHARAAGLVSDATLFVVDNGPPESRSAVQRAAAQFGDAGRVEEIHGHGNVGYGRANNLVLPRLASDFHLVMLQVSRRRSTNVVQRHHPRLV